LDTQDRNE
jgi:hypothetical protein